MNKLLFINNLHDVILPVIGSLVSMRKVLAAITMLLDIIAIKAKHKKKKIFN
jgi:hypothetical protein